MEKLKERTKPGVLLVNGDFVYNQNGTMVDICEYRNCRQSCEQGWIKCNKHRDQPDKLKCRGCGKFTVLPKRGIQKCPTPNCKSGSWIT